MQKLKTIYDKLRAFGSFLAVPFGVVACFLLLSVLVYRADAEISKSAVKNSAVLGRLEDLFGDRGSTRELLSTLSSAIITVTSITFSLLLLAVQQGASSFSNQILDQFLKRRANQFYFGFFIGLSLFLLLTLATMRDLHHPLLGAVASILLTIAALCLMLVLIYTTIDQMRSTQVIAAIAQLVRSARKHERGLLSQTRSPPAGDYRYTRACKAEAAGVVAGIDVQALECLSPEGSSSSGTVISVRAPKGTYVAKGDVLLELRSHEPLAKELADTVQGRGTAAFSIGQERRADQDCRVGMQQLATIGWNSASSARSNPQPPIAVLRTITQLVREQLDDPPQRNERSAVAYPDTLIEDALGAFASIVVAAAESKQHQTLSEAYQRYANFVPELSKQMRSAAQRAIVLSLPALREHVPTPELEQALSFLSEALRPGAPALAQQIATVLSNEQLDGHFDGELDVQAEPSPHGRERPDAR